MTTLRSPRSCAALWTLGMAVALGATASAQTGARFERIWGGESRQAFTLEVGADRHVWTAGDGPGLRHAINPGVSTTWDLQTLPADVTQNLLDVHFIEGHEPSGPAHLGFAVGLNGHVLKTVDYGTTWLHLDSGEVENQLGLGEHAALWRGRFLNEDDGFALGLWTFQRWNGTTWNPVSLLDANNQPIDAARFEFYTLELLIDPNDPDRWIGIAGGQLWGDPGGGHGSSGVLFRGSSNSMGGNTWTEVFRTEDTLAYEDPWDFEFEPNPASLTSAVGYLACGTNTDTGAVFRSTNSGLTFDAMADLDGAATLYGIAVQSADEAVAVGYGGQIWARDASGWTCRRGTGTLCALPPGVTETHTTPLSGARAAGSDVYVTGTSGFVRVSSDQFATASTDLFPTSAEDKTEQWRLADLAFSSATHGYSVAAKKMILETTDGGLDWDFAPTTPNALVSTDTTPLTAVDFREGGGRGVAVGWGRIDALAPFATPTLDQAFAYYLDENDATPTWTPSTLTFAIPAPNEWLLLDDVAWAGGDGATAEFWAVGRYGRGNNPYAPVQVTPALLRSTDGGASWSDGGAFVNGGLPSSVRFNALTFAAPAVGFAVGGDVSTLDPVAYLIHLPSAGPNVGPLPVFGTENMLDVAANPSLAVAVGANEAFYVLVESTLEFWQIPAPALGHAAPVDFLSVAMSPTGVRFLIGAAASIAEADAPGIGKALYFDGDWNVIPGGTNKDLHSIVLRAVGGFALGGFVAGLSDSSEMGMGADSSVLRFLEPGS